MVEAYKIGVSLVFKNEVSAGLRAVTRELVALQRQIENVNKALGSLGKGAGKSSAADGARAGREYGQAFRKEAETMMRGIKAPSAAARVARASSGGRSSRSGHSTDLMMAGMGGEQIAGYGEMMFQGLHKAYDASKEYEQAFSRFKALNLGEQFNQDADQFARATQLYGVNATDLITTVRDLHTALGHYGPSKELAPFFAQLSFANKAVFNEHGMKLDENQIKAMEKVIEMRGGFKSPEEFKHQADMMQKVVSATGGMVQPQDYLQFIKTAGVSGKLLNEESFYFMMEPLIQELSGNRVGTAFMSGYNNLVQGRSTVRSAKEMMRLGILDPKMVEYDKAGQIKQIKPGALQGSDQFGKDPFHWLMDTLIPAMKSKGITSDDAIMNEIGTIMGNRTGANLFGTMWQQREKIEKNMAVSKNAMGADALIAQAMQTPAGAEMALSKSWTGFLAELGRSVVPIVVPALTKLTGALQGLTAWERDHPDAVKNLLKAGAIIASVAVAFGSALAFFGSIAAIASLGAGGMAAIGISALGAAIAGLVTAAMMGSGRAKAAFDWIVGAIQGLGAKAMAAWPTIKSAFAGIISTIWNVSGKAADIVVHIAKSAVNLGSLFVTEMKTVAVQMVDAAKQFGADLWTALKSAFQYVTEQVGSLFKSLPDLLKQYSPISFHAPPSSQGGVIQVSTYLDGRKVAESVTKHQSRAADRPSQGGGRYDGSRSPSYPGSIAGAVAI